MHSKHRTWLVRLASLRLWPLPWIWRGFKIAFHYGCSSDFCSQVQMLRRGSSQICGVLIRLTVEGLSLATCTSEGRWSAVINLYELQSMDMVH